MKEGAMMSLKRKTMVKWCVAIGLILMLFGYYALQPAIVFHSPNEDEYLGKAVCTYSGEQVRLYIKDKPVVYRIPYTYNWRGDDEVSIFMKNYGSVLKKGDIDFWRLDIYLDKDGYCTKSEKRRLLNLFPL